MSRHSKSVGMSLRILRPVMLFWLYPRRRISSSSLNLLAIDGYINSTYTFTLFVC